LTGRPALGSAGEGAARLLPALAEVIAEHGISVLSERVYALRSAREEVLELRAKALSTKGLASDAPVTFLQGTPASGEAFGGVQLWGVTPRAGAGQRVELVERDGQVVGREWIGPDFRQLVLTSIHGMRSGAPPDAPEQARRMFERAGATLAARGYSFREVARTWIYFARLLDWYGDFNAVRNAYYTAAGLSKSAAAGSGSAFPASTGIQAQSASEECLMDVLAIDLGHAGRLAVRPVAESGRQGQASLYGSAFSRAMVIDWADCKIIHVSGTASIDQRGHSTHPGDAGAQFRDTLASIDALLEPEGAGLSNLCQGTLFAKSAAVAAICRDVARELGSPALPFVEVIADVCRPELLVEIEAVAIVRGAGGRPGAPRFSGP
jgi:enamine deaminase RidA (YjgF/YER057c/UK114 family)